MTLLDVVFPLMAPYSRHGHDRRAGAAARSDRGESGRAHRRWSCLVAKGAAQTDRQGTFTRLCIPPPSNRAGGGTCRCACTPTA